ncbi:RidA family protein [Olivibacter domesticus]|nr:RidA family protein [Olivibacter domesticus]
MRKLTSQTNQLSLIVLLMALTFTIQSCEHKDKESTKEATDEVIVETEKPEYFYLRPEFEKAQGYTHAVKVGDIIRISGAVSMDDKGNAKNIGDLGQQMRNCYADLEKILNHYGCTFDDVIVENIFTTNMPAFLKNAAYRNKIYTKQFPTGNWVGVKELVIPDIMIEIGLEVYKPD